MKKQNKKTIKNKYLVVALLLLLIGTGTYLVINKSSDSNNSSTENQEDNTGFGPATDQERQEAEDHKDKLSNMPSEDDPDQAGIRSVTPVITIAGQFNDEQYGERVEVRAYVSEVYESDGKCTATFTLGGQTVSRTVEALKDATTTRCDTIMIPRSEFPSSGSWQLVVSYKSPKALGSSQTVEVNIE